MGIIEKYSRATQSSNLKCDEHHYDTDSLAAVALSSELGAALFRVKYGNDATSYVTLLAAWHPIVTKKAEMRQWPKHVTAKKVAGISLDYWLNDICPLCQGKGHKTLAGAPVLSDESCIACGGSGKKPIICEKNWLDYVQDMVDVLDRMTMHAAGEAMRKLASDLDF